MSQIKEGIHYYR